MKLGYVIIELPISRSNYFLKSKYIYIHCVNVQLFIVFFRYSFKCLSGDLEWLVGERGGDVSGRVFQSFQYHATLEVCLKP